MTRSKIETFIGFSIRARKLVAGTNAISFAKGIRLIILCHTGSENAKKQALCYAKKYHVPLILTKEKTLSELVNKNNCKMCAILDKNFADSIIRNINQEYEIIFRGDK